MFLRKGFILYSKKSSLNIKRGFTLIELLVVVAIIGVLATIVLTNLNSARKKAQDAKIKSLMGQMRAQAELFYLSNNSYYGDKPLGRADDSIGECAVLSRFGGSVFGSDIEESIYPLMKSVTDITGNISIRIRCAYGNTANDSWAFAAPLFRPTSGSTGWCVDSSGNSKESTIDFTSSGGETGGASRIAICP